MKKLEKWALFFVAFGVFWLIPLLMPIGSLERYAFEELRVLLVGAMGGIIFMLYYGRRKKK